MNKENLLLQGNEAEQALHSPNIHRRNFLMKMGGTVAIAAGFAACTKSVSNNVVSSGSADQIVGLGTGDTAILNYAYLLEQLEAAFYTMVFVNLYSGITTLERDRLGQVRDHEIAHREFFKTALGSDAIASHNFDFSSIDFTNRMSVLSAAKSFEDTGVSAYNGAGYLIQTPKYLLIAGKIVSVEARHAAYIRDLLDPLSFADRTAVNSDGLDLFRSPLQVAKIIAPYLKLPIDLTKFPYTI